jgi:hypothetical protein
MSSNTNFIDIVTDEELRNKKATLRLYQRKYDEYMVEFQKRLNLPLPGQKFWSIHQVDFDDPKVRDLKVGFRELMDNIHRLGWEIKKDEAVLNNTLDEYYATRKAYSFLDSQEDGGISFLQEHHMTTHSLIYKLMENPHFIEDEEHIQWLPVVRVDDSIFVKTNDGVEPVRKANLRCENIEVGDYAICKSIRNNLFMFYYCKEEVEA